jgi:hypothetical protein
MIVKYSWGSATLSWLYQVLCYGCIGKTFFIRSVYGDFSSSWDIRVTLTFFFLKNGQQVDKLIGVNKMELKKKVAALAGSDAPGHIVPS